jgi:glutamate carboxypeptidase
MGIAIAYFALAALRDLSISPKSKVVILLNSDEEIGSLNSRRLVEEEAEKARAVYCLEPSFSGGALKTARKGVGRLKLKALGKAAHSGTSHREGISATEELARQILYIHSLTDYSRGITLNVGRIEGGTRSNVVAAEANAEIDLRFLTPEDGEEMMEKLLSLKPRLSGAKLEITGRIASPPMVKTDKNRELFNKVKEIAASFGIELTDGLSGGGSDASFASAVGTPTIDGLGADGEGLHAVNEHVIIKSLPERALLLSLILTSI